MSDEIFSSDALSTEEVSVGEAILTEAVRHKDIIHTSLAGMTAIILMLAGAISLPVLNLQPVTHPNAILVVWFTVITGISVLYYMNYKVHRHVSNQAALTEVLVNSLGQGFLTFDSKGMCGSVYSQACEDLLEILPAGRNIAEVLKVPEDKLGDFKDWLDVLFIPNHALGFEDVVGFFPQFFIHSKDRRIKLEYRPIKTGAGVLKQVVMIATDQTEEYQAIQQAKQKQAFADMICRIFKDRNQFQFTLMHLRNFLVVANSSKITLNESKSVLRQLHTLKAAVRHFNLLELGEIIHQTEMDLKSPAVANDEMFRKHLLTGRQRMSIALDHVMKDVRELINNEHDLHGTIREIEEARLYSFASELQSKGVKEDIIKEFLRDIVAVPVNDCLKSFEFDLQDIINAKNKQVKPIRFAGTNPRIITLPIQNFLFSLTHICRNIADHGIEAPSTRVSRGKDPSGLVTVETSVENISGVEWLRMVISDDGIGIDPLLIREKLSLVDPEGAWRDEGDEKVIQHIFDSNFTTRESVSELSGQGVGLEAVAQEVSLLGGAISVRSVFGQGTNFEIRVPYFMDLSFMTKTAENG